MKRLARLAGPLVVLAIFTAAVWLLYRELHHYHYRDIRASLAAIPAGWIWTAVVLTVLNYVVLIGYDYLAVRSIGHPLPLGRIAVASFIGYVTSYNFGALLGGTSVRYRLYSNWGLSAVEIVKLLTLLLVTFWIGFFALCGVVFVSGEVVVPPRFNLPFADIRLLGAALLVLVALYLGLCAWRREPIQFRGWEISLPSLRVVPAQIVIASADLLLAAATLYVLLPPSMGVSYPRFLGVYLLGILAIIFTHVPGGLGVFELVVLTMLSPSQPQQVLSSLLVFRAVYYLFPLLIATTMLAVHEMVVNWEDLRRAVKPVGRMAPILAPRLLALLMFLAGAILLFSGATPEVRDRLGWLRPVVPPAVIELSHFMASVLGVVLLLVARSLQRRLDAAYWLSLVMLVAGITLSLLKGLDYEEAAILAAIALALVPARKYFYRKGSFLAEPLSPGWITAVLLVVVCSVWIGIFAHKQRIYSGESWWQFAFGGGSASRFLRASAGAAVTLLIFAVARLLRPAAPRPQPPSAAELEAAARIVASSPATYAHLALLGDKMLLLDEEQSAFVMYGISGRSWVAMGDPVGPPRKQSELAWRFREMCDRYDAWPVFYQVDQTTLPIYLDLGLSLLKLGEEAWVRLSDFSLEGRDRKPLRHTYNRFQRDHCRFEIVPAAAVRDLVPELRAVSDAWLREKDAREKGFSLGFFDPGYLARYPVAVVRENGRIVAFANVLSGAEKQELSVDLMRYLVEAPDGVMEYLLIEMMFWGKQEGYCWFNLGMAPLSGLENRALATTWNRLGNLIFEHGEHFYNFRGLRRYKEKFNPQWRPKYLASPGGIVLPRILADIATLISRGMKGWAGK
jgi:phosphatidylglycerol lysyltransferase